MALSDGLKLGGVYLEVRLDKSKIPGDIRDVERTLRSARIGLPVGPAHGSLSGGSGGSSRAVGGSMSSSGAAAALGLSGLAGLKTELTKQSTLLARIAASTAAVAATNRQQDAAARYVYNADRADYRRAGLSASLRQVATGRFTRVDRTQGGAVNASPADIRFFGGIGFDEASGYRARGRRAASPDATAMAAPAAIDSPLLGAASDLKGAAADLSAAASSLRSGGTGTGQRRRRRRGAVPLSVQEAMASMGAGEAGELLADAWPGGTHKRGGFKLKPGPVRGRFYGQQVAGSIDPSQREIPPPSAMPLGMTILPMGTGAMLRNAGMGAMRGALRGVSAFEGRASEWAGSGGAGRLAGSVGRGTGRVLSETIRLVPRLTGLIGVLGDSSILAFNAMQQGIARSNFGLQRYRTTLSPLVTLASLPFKLALAPLRLFGHGVDETGRKLGTLQTTMRTMGATATLPFRAAHGAAGILLGTLKTIGTHLAIMGGIHAAASVFRGVGGASNMAETVNVTGQAFGTAAGSVRRDASAMANEFGLVEEAVLRSSNSFGLLLTGMGMGQAEAATMSTRLAKLTADMSSFFNVSQEEASGTIASALRNQFEPISRFGVMIRKEDITNLAEARGETGRLGEATAALDLIFRGLAPAMGDLERTMGSNANLSREIGGRFRNMATDIGSALLPAVTEAKLLILDLFQAGSGGGGGNPLLGFFQAVGERAQSFIRVIRLGVENFSTFVEAGKISAQGVGTAFGRLFSYVMDAGKTFFGWFIDNWKTILTDMGNAFITFSSNFGQNVMRLGQAVKDFASGKGWKFQAKGLLEGFTASTPALPQLPALDLGLGDVRQQIVDLLLPIFEGNGNRRGDGEEGAGPPRGRVNEEAVGQLGDTLNQGRRRSSAQLVSAQGLVELQNSSAGGERERQIADNTRLQLAEMQKLNRFLENSGLRQLNGLMAVVVP